MIDIKTLEHEFYNHTLTEYLKHVSNKNLYNYLGIILRNDIIGIRVNIYDEILNEMNYRGLEKVVNNPNMSTKKHI